MPRRLLLFAIPALVWITSSLSSLMAQDTDSSASLKAQPEQALFEDDGYIPNSTLPVLIYRQAFDAEHSPGDTLAERIVERFASHGWSGSWRGKVFRYHHYHSTSHEVLGVYQGSATLQIGGEKGRIFELKEGDIIILPAGTGHKRLSSSDDFGVVGAYPGGQDWDLLKGKPGERPRADKNIAAVKLPEQDPVRGKNGALVKLWKN